MAPHRLQGPMCIERQPVWLDDEVMCRVPPSSPVPTGHERFAWDEPVHLAEPQRICGPVNAEDEEILSKVRRMREWAKKLGFHQAVAALDHFLGNTGTFVEIPSEKVKQVRAESEGSHKTKLLQAVRGHFGAPTMLAFTGLVTSNGKAKPEQQWPERVEFVMDYTSGTARPGISDDNLTYYGSMIKSEVTLRCIRKAKTRSYDCEIIRWRSWVVDNYDWEGEFTSDKEVEFKAQSRREKIAGRTATEKKKPRMTPCPFLGPPRKC